MLAYLLFIFVAFGSKLVLALLTIYYLFPSDASCPGCDGETLLVRMSRGGRLLSLVFLGRVRSRWCPRCRWEGLTRPRAAPAHRRVPRVVPMRSPNSH